VLRFWLGAADYQAFTQHRRERRAFSLPSATGGAKALFDWAVMERVLAARPDLLVVRDGQLCEQDPAPTVLPELRAMMMRGVGIVVRRAQTVDAALYALARGFEREFSTELQLQLFVTPRRTRGFGWHYDHEDVLILQTSGIKTYYFRANTCVREPLPERADFSQLTREVSPLMACTLCAGDLLYLPRGTWHMARAREDSLSISLGLKVDNAPCATRTDLA
jgi:hypothetical protein